MVCCICDKDPCECEGSLDACGCIPFTGPEALEPSGVYFASGFVGIEQFIKALVLIDNEAESGIKIVKWKEGDPIPDGILAVQMNSQAIKLLQASNNGRGILMREADGSPFITIDQWREKYNTEPLGLLARMRLFWLRGGGVACHPRGGA